MSFRFTAIALASLLGFVAAAPAAEPPLRLRADNWMPFNGDHASELPGYVVELAREIFGADQVDYQIMPWTDALKAAASGEIDGVIGANPTEGAGLVFPAEPIALTRIGLFTRKDNPWTFDSLKSLETVRLGAIEGYSYWEGFDAYLKAHTPPKVTLFSGENPLKDALGKLQAKEIDVMAETLQVFVWNTKEVGLKFSDFRMAYLHDGDPIFLAFTPKGDRGKAFAARFDQGVAALRKSGKLATILKKYGLNDWKP